MDTPCARSAVLIAATALLLSLVACTRPNAGVCCTDPTDCQSIGASEAERPCTMGLSCIDHECSVPPTPPPPPPCETDADCDGGTPHCSPNNVCVGCIDSTQCAGTTPTCEPTTNQCRACAIDDDCESGVCDGGQGSCAASNTIIYAAPGGSDAATCTPNDACSITHAFASTTSEREIIKLAAGSYTAHISPNAGTVVVHGAGALVTAPAGARAFDVAPSTRLTLQGLSIKQPNTDSTNGFAIECSTQRTPVILDSVTIDTANTAIALCSVTITRSIIRGSNPSGLALLYVAGTNSIDRSLLDGGTGLLFIDAGAIAHISNSVIANQVGSLGAIASLGSNPAAAIFVSYSTVINSLLKCGSDTPTCAGGTAAGVCIDNSVVFNGSAGAPVDTITGGACRSNYNLVFPQSAVLTGANNKPGIQPNFVDVASGNFHLKANSFAVDAADPLSPGTPDFDGVARPQGTSSDMGAFELKH